MTELLLKAPPHSIEAEQSLLGALLLDNDSYDRVATIVTAADFYRDDHRRIWGHIVREIEASRPADMVTVWESIAKSDDRDKTGGPAYLGALAQNTPSATNIRRYAELVREKSILRALLSKAGEITAACLAGAEDAREIAQRAEAMVLEVLDSELPADVELPRLMMEAVHRADEARRGEGPRGLRTGFADLDAKLGGLMPGQLVILAARPSVGKTALALNIAEHVAARQAVGFFSCEMSREELGQRLLASASGVPLHQIRSGSLDDAQVNGLAEIAGQLGQRRLLIDDRAAVSVGYIRARCRRWKRRHGLALLVVDYMQLMRGEGETREQEVASLSRGLKALAKELHVPVIALCQLNRALEGRTDKRPQLYDLRESGAIEQDADIVMALYREDIMYGDADSATPNRGLCQVLVRKHRNGPLGDVTLRYVPELCRFESTQERFSAGVAPIRPVSGFRASRPDAADFKMRAAADQPEGGAP